MKAFDILKQKKQIDDFTLEVLRLARSENVGSVTFYELIKLFKTPKKALEMLPSMAERGGLKRKITIPSNSDIQKEVDKTLDFGGEFLSVYDERYPYLLRKIKNPPPILVIKGNVELLRQNGFAIVGSRNASVNGSRIAYKFAKEMAERGYVSVSGLARGIDTAVHKATISSGTIAVIAGGINNVYPAENKDLYKEIEDNGLLISETPIDSAPKSQNFPQRNRIISGLSMGVLVVEASQKSGSLITAKYAIEQNREVFAVPGFPLDLKSQGPNQLIKDGAKLVQSVNDILDELNDFRISPIQDNDNTIYTPVTKVVTESELSDVRKIVLEKLNYTPITIDEILNFTDIDYSALMIALLELEIAGRLIRAHGNKVSLKLVD